MDTITQISPPVTQADLNKEAVRAQRAEDKAAEYVNAHPHLTMYNGLSLMVTPEGDPCAFYHDTLYHESHLRVNGQKPIYQSHSFDPFTNIFTFNLRVPASGSSMDFLEITREIFIGEENTVHIGMNIRNNAQYPLPVILEFGFGGRQRRDIYEIRFGDIQQHWGKQHARELGKDWVVIINDGAEASPPAKRFQQYNHLHFGPVPTQLSGDSSRYDLQLAPGEAHGIVMNVQCIEIKPGQQPPAPPHRPPQELYLETRRALAGNIESIKKLMTCITTGNPGYNKVIEQAFLDQRMLSLKEAEGVFPAAGIPWFARLFGRDSLTAARFNMWRDPEMAKVVLKVHRANQATGFSDGVGAEPGKICHEVSFSEMCRNGEFLFGHNYWGVEQTMLYVITGGELLDRSADAVFIREMWPSFENALDWAEKYGNLSGDGLLRFRRHNEREHAAQGWQDSGDANFDENGNLPTGAVALVEVQGHFYQAKLQGAKMATRVAALERGEGNELEAVRLETYAAKLTAQATALRRQIEDRFWDEKLGTYIVALDDDRPFRIPKSNPGQLLASGVPSPEHARHVVERLMRDDMFSGWGIRTLARGVRDGAAEGPKYDPLGYHGGTVWPHDNGIIIQGMRNYGFDDEAARVQHAIAEAAALFVHTPELFSGTPRQPGKAPEKYPNACPIHIFGASAQVGIPAAMAGLGFNPAEKSIHFQRPYLHPSMGGKLTLCGLHFGDGESVDVTLHGEGHTVTLGDVVHHNGNNIKVALETTLPVPAVGLIVSAVKAPKPR